MNGEVGRNESSSIVPRSRALFLGLCCLALISWPARATIDLVSALGVESLPGGCGNPFVDVASFMAFYDSSIKMMAAKRGPEAKGVSELFAVSEMRDEIAGLAVNPTDDSALDRLIVSQLCEFQKIEMKNFMQKSSSSPLQILSSSEALHDHLATIAPKLFRDCRKLVVDALAERSRAKSKDDLLAAKVSDISKARELGRKKIKDLFD